MQIPTDLKRGDKLWYSETECATVGPTKYWPTCYDHGSIRARVAWSEDTMIYCLDSGREYLHQTPPIIRIERIASAKKKVKADKDAVWLLRLVSPTKLPGFNRRIRAIARRLDWERKA